MTDSATHAGETEVIERAQIANERLFASQLEILEKAAASTLEPYEMPPFPPR